LGHDAGKTRAEISMTALATAIAVCWVMLNAIRQLRENRWRGIKFEWSKALVTAGGCILITVVALGCMFGAFALNQPALGGVLVAVVMIGGLIGLVVEVNRYWPTRTGS
jgi:amino acid transporter